ncbi:hypothetical protein LVY74_04735 [Acinetobacter sp. ME22]|uniref:hypothetical protein n=1 Tax=Acinetobacter sp. ME22 TaxID=2904802 RepID=UPI001EDBF80C|nr:hypothetical protein [Acinetobacter sp. ME22]MCG2572864.1 hypothetical protein [Acinetobacter sp. ME22]
MFDFYLPLESYFVKILLENKIQNWEAKLFWLNIEHLNQLEDKTLRQQMYNGLRVLTSNGFLSVEYSRYNDRVFLYSETIKLYGLREQVLAKNYNKLIQNEKKLINKELEDFELQNKFIDELYLKYPELAPQYFKLKNKISLSQQYSDAKLKAIEGLMELI